MKFKVVGKERLIVPDVEHDQRMSPLDNFRWTSGANVQAGGFLHQSIALIIFLLKTERPNNENQN